MYWLSPFARLLRWLLERAVGSVVKSPLEQDFGSESTTEIAVPDTMHRALVPLDGIGDPLMKIFELVDGLRVEHVKKVAVRLHELPVGRTAEFRYQVRDAGAPVELQITMAKFNEELIEMEFRSSEGVIGSIAAAFEDGGAVGM